MPLFSERYGYRQQKKLTYNISNSMYDVILADCKIKPNTLHKKTAETLMVID